MSCAKNGCDVTVSYAAWDIASCMYVFTDGPNTHCAPGVCSKDSAYRSARSKAKGKVPHMEPYLKLWHWIVCEGYDVVLGEAFLNLLNK